MSSYFSFLKYFFPNIRCDPIVGERSKEAFFEKILGKPKVEKYFSAKFQATRLQLITLLSLNLKTIFRNFAGIRWK